MPRSYTNLFWGETFPRLSPGPLEEGFPRDERTERILKIARLHDDEGLLRLGWIWVAGRHPEHGQVFFPLASMRVQTPPLHAVRNTLNRALRAGYRFADVVPASELEVTELIEDGDVRDELADIPHGLPSYSTLADEFADPRATPENAEAHRARADLRSWAERAAEAAGATTSILLGAEHPADAYVVSGGLQVIVGLGLYVAEPETTTRRITTASTLRSWAEEDVADTAFGHLYSDAESPAADDDASNTIARSSILLNPTQERVVAASRRQRLTVVSGPPGTGKSQTVVAAALRHVADGRSVLVTAPTAAAVSALVALLETVPGPDPVVFGASMKRLDVANRLAEGAGPWFDDAAVERTRRAAEDAEEEYHRRRDQIAGLLRSELAAANDPADVLAARQQAPGLFDADVDLFAVEDLARRAGASGGWFTRRRAHRAGRDLRAAARCDRTLDVGEIQRLVGVARSRRRAAELESSGGLELERSWERLIEADERSRRAAGEALQAATHHDDRADRASRRAIGAVATALRSGRAKRRDTLAGVSGRELTEALPLWVATMRDIDDLLPMQTDLFDIVIIDEASHIDQIGAAPALLRARDAVIVGDPRQLRHVSFLAEDRVEEAIDRNGLTGAAVTAQLDVRRQTLFDSAAAVAPVVMLDEHYRSAPHLIGFSADRFYDGRLYIATRHPRNEREDRIHVVESAGKRSDEGINEVEVELIVDQLRQELVASSPSVGVLTPFRAQADAIEDAVLAAFDLDDIDALDLRIGTVHSFQGCQRDLVHLSLALDDDSPGGSRAFLGEATLFNVMVTRARDEIHVLTSMQDPGRGVLADYLRYAGEPPSSGSQSAATTGWAERVRAELALTGQPITTGYPTGRHVVDIVLGSGSDAVAVVCGVHPDGADAHIARRLDLERSGWSTFEAFESRWGDHLQELAIELAPRTRPEKDPTE
ncbi:MAG: DEAD/DEAH box helicase [Ilumatobacteraceae bacterium]